MPCFCASCHESYHYLSFESKACSHHRVSTFLYLLKAETEQKDNFAAALAANRKALDESRQERGSLRYEVDAKNRKAEALATELHLTETSLSERQAEVALLKGHERDYLLKIATLEVKPIWTKAENMNSSRTNTLRTAPLCSSAERVTRASSMPAACQRSLALPCMAPTTIKQPAYTL